MTFSNRHHAFMNELAEEFLRDHDQDDDQEDSDAVPVLPDEATPQVTPAIREAFAALDSYPTCSGRSLQPITAAPVLSVRQAPYFND